MEAQFLTNEYKSCNTKWVLVFAYFATFILGIFWVNGCTPESFESKKTHIRPVKIKTIELEPLKIPQWFSGTVNALKHQDLTFSRSGTIETFYVKEGDLIQVGQILASLKHQTSPKTFQPHTEQQSSIRGELVVLEQRIRGLERLLTTTQTQYQNLQELFQEEIIPKARLYEVRQTLEKQQTQMETLQQKRQQLLSQIESFVDLPQMPSTQKHNSNTHELKAPFNGRVQKQHLSEPHPVSSKAIVYTVEYLQKVQISLQIPSALISTLSLSNEVNVRVDELQAASFTGILVKRQVSPQDPNMTHLIVEVDNPNSLVLPGMQANIQLSLVQQKNDIPTLPQHAILQDPITQISYVWILDPSSQQVKRRDVQLGTPNQHDVPIPQGLRQNDQVIVSGVSLLEANMKVRLPQPGDLIHTE